MNTGALFLLAIGIALLILGFKGDADNIVAAVTGKAYKNSSLK